MNLPKTAFAALAMLCMTCLFGCNRPSPPPEPLTMAEMPAALQQGFATATPEVKTASDQLLALVQKQDYAKAFVAAQSLSSTPGLTKEQATVLARATLTLNSAMQEAQTKGDAQVTRTLQNYNLNK